MASSSNPPDALGRIPDYEYLYVSNTNVSNFVSVKLCGARNYQIWKTQMICLMEAHDMLGLVDEGSIDSSMKDMAKYESLLKGWILGSVSEDVLRIVVDSKSSAKAKDVWNTLKRYFNATTSSDDQQDSTPTKTDTNTDSKDKNVVLEEIPTNDKCGNSTESEAKGEATTQTETEEADINDKDISSANSEAKREDTTQPETKDSAPIEVDKKIERKAKNGKTEAKSGLQKAIQDDDWDEVCDMLIRHRDAIIEQINSDGDGNTALHIAVGIGRNDVIKRVLRHTDDDLRVITNSDGSTLLHIAAIVGNTDAAEFFVRKDPNLLVTSDKDRNMPLDKAVENMQLHTIAYLLEAIEQEEKKKKDFEGQKRKIQAISAKDSDYSHLIGAKLLVQAISAKEYEFASKLVNTISRYAVLNDEVLMAIARIFPSGLDDLEKLFYPNLDNLHETIFKRSKDLFKLLVAIYSLLKEIMSSILSCEDGFKEVVVNGVLLILVGPAAMVYWIFLLILLLLLMVYFPFFMLYFLFWKVAMRVVPPIRSIEQKKKQFDEAKKVLELVCKKIYETDADGHEKIYKGPILEAARQNAYEVVVEILTKWPKAIRCKDENGYDIIQLATIHRSEKIYNLIYMIGDRKNIYRTIIDCYGNNMLHLAGRLAPSYKLKLRTGAALQLQSELQWREEVKKLVFPSFHTEDNIFKETPDMVFTKEHANLVEEAEKWIRIVAESCSITAALITTIVFAAAITVPGGMTQETGIPVYKKEIAFTVFVVSDAISLVSSVTALLVFLSIVSARFAEQDFLLRLPRQMLIGLCTLFLSTAAMMVAFGATFFLVFTDHQLWMLAPICGFCFLPIAIYFHLQVPLIIDLFRSTYTSMFGRSSQIIPNAIRFLFWK